MQNLDFKAFVDAQGNVSSTYVEEGFENSRRGLNFEKRVSDNCPKEVKDSEKNEGPALDDLAQSYQKMGCHLGYFDEQGNLLKPLKDLSGTNPTTNNSDPLNNIEDPNKVKQIDALKTALNTLPVGPQAKEKINKVNTRPSLNWLVKNGIGCTRITFGYFFARSTGDWLQNKINQRCIGCPEEFCS